MLEILNCFFFFFLLFACVCDWSERINSKRVMLLSLFVWVYLLFRRRLHTVLRQAFGHISLMYR